MDIFVGLLDKHVLTPHVYPATFKEDDVYRQSLTIFLFLIFGALTMYFIIAGLTYVFLFDKELRKHPKFLPDQEKIEIKYALTAIPWIALYSTPIFVAEVRGHSKLYGNIDESTGGWEYVLKSLVAFLIWNDFWVYIVHRILHLPGVYARVHKTHHLFKIHTPFAALAFTPLDGFSQSLPYHCFVFLFPMHKITYVLSFIGVQIWTIMIHDHFFVIPDWLDPIINGSAHHSDHHEWFNYNHGLFFTVMDRIGGTYRVPSATRGIGPHDYIKKMKEEQDGATNKVSLGDMSAPAFKALPNAEEMKRD